MKIVGLDGRSYSWNLRNHVPFQDAKRPRSRYHLRARWLLKKKFPRDRILEEVPLVGSHTPQRRSILYVDFFIPNKTVVIEVHGEQHYSFNEFFHKTKAEFYRSKKRDQDKSDWCALNSINIVVLKYSEPDDVWSKRIDSSR